MISLRTVQDSDRDVFFGSMQDAGAVDMAAFTPEDPADRETSDARGTTVTEHILQLP